MKITERMIIDARQKVESEDKNYATLSALEKHVAAFGKTRGEHSVSYSASDIDTRLRQHGENHSTVVGRAIFSFNAVHSGSWPYGNVAFSCPKQTDYGASLHLGTLRFYKKDGSFNQNNWDEFAIGMESISESTLVAYLSGKNNVLPDEADTGRNANSFFASRSLQQTAGSTAWHEAFKILACDWTVDEKTNDLEPSVDAVLLELFFKDTLTCLELAKKLELPVAQPSLDAHSFVS